MVVGWSGLTNLVPGVVCRLRRIQSSRYEIGLQMQNNSGAELTYTTLVRNYMGPPHWLSC